MRVRSSEKPRNSAAHEYQARKGQSENQTYAQLPPLRGFAM